MKLNRARKMRSPSRDRWQQRTRAAATPLRWPLLLVVGVALTNRATAAEVNDNPLPKILADWQKRRDRLSTVRYRLTGTRSWPRAAFNEDLNVPHAKNKPTPDNPENDLEGSLNRTVLLDFQRNRDRIEWDDVEYDNLSRQLFRIRATHACDGETLYSRIFENSDPSLRTQRAKKHVDLIIYRGLIPVGIFTDTYLPLFLGHGIITYNFDVRVRPGALAPKPIPADFSYHGRAVYAGRPCAVLRTRRTMSSESEFWVDLQRESAVVKVVNNPDRSVISSIIGVQYRETVHGWLVDRWNYTYSEGGRSVCREDMHVDETAANIAVADEDFTVEINPGLYIEEQNYYIDPKSKEYKSTSRYYQINSGKEDTVLNSKLYPIAEPPRQGMKLRTILGISGLVISIIVLLWARRGRRARKIV